MSAYLVPIILYKTPIETGLIATLIYGGREQMM
jgi:hypothetical protein